MPRGTIGIRDHWRVIRLAGEVYPPWLVETGTSPQSVAHTPISPPRQSPPMTPPHTPSENHTADVSARSGDDLPVALGRIPSGLFVITWREADRDRGMLASWVMQAGFAPPMVTVAVAPGRALLAAIDAGGAFVVNVLAERQRPLLARFGKPAAPEEDPFAGIGVGRAPCGAPTIHEAAAWLECRPVSQTAGGAETPSDHVIVLAGVTAAGAEWDVQPLVHVRKNGLRY